MKKLMVSFMSVCALVAGVLAAGAAPTNFAGTWALDKQKSQGMQGPMANLDVMMTVTQDGKQVTVETKYSGGTGKCQRRKQPTI